LTASFQLTLDTHAPLVTWGAVGGANAGELLQVGYQLDEPGVESARVQLADGRWLTLTDTGATLEVQLPPDTPDGWATVELHVRDDVDNTAVWTHVVRLTGVIVIPQPQETVGGAPWRVGPRRTRRAALERRTIRTRATATSTSATRIRTSARDRATAIGTSRSRLRAAAAHRSTWTAGSRVALYTGPRVSRDSSHELRSSATVSRRDGPSIEAILLGLL
jgi:hypothetical protein